MTVNKMGPGMSEFTVYHVKHIFTRIGAALDPLLGVALHSQE